MESPRLSRTCVDVGSTRWSIDVVLAGGAQDEDRVACLVDGHSVRLCLADGAGGTGRGAAAADALIATLSSNVAPLLMLADADVALAPGGGECAAVVADVTLQLDRMTVTGASVGDSRAWARVAGDWRELTAQQRRKPLLGSGRAVPIVFRPTDADVLVMATDGLASFASSAAIAATVEAEKHAEELGIALVELVRLPSGALADDVAAIVVRLAC